MHVGHEPKLTQNTDTKRIDRMNPIIADPEITETTSHTPES